MSDPLTIAIISGGLQVVSMMQQADAADQQASAMRDSAAEQKKAEQAKQRMAETEAARQRVSQAREARMRRAEVLAKTGNQGIGVSSSGVAGGTGSITSQMGSNIGFINQQETFAGQASTAMQASADAQGRASAAQAEGQQWQMIGGLAHGAFTQAGGFTTIFGGNTIQKAG